MAHIGKMAPTTLRDPFEKSDKTYDILSVSKHNTEDDAWVAINGGVYDVTKFIKFHPGGKEILTKNLGVDLTEAFQSKDIHEHSEKAWRMLEQYKIGTLQSEKSNLKENYTVDPKYMKLVDMDKPVVNQVVNMQPDLYQKWLHSYPTAISMRLFETNFMEKLSHYVWWYIFPLWVPVISYFCFASLKDGHGILGLASSFTQGLLFWSFLEYTLHRFMFHLETSSAWGNFYHFMAHGIHHLSPLDPTRLTFPPVFSIFIVAGFYKLFENLAIPNFNAFFAGGLFGYLMYDTMHFFFHHGTLCEKFGYLKWMRTRHFRHHYVCDNKNFGVSSPIWDYVFGTYE